MELVTEVVKLVTAILLLVAAALKILSMSKADGSYDDTGKVGRNPE